MRRSTHFLAILPSLFSTLHVPSVRTGFKIPIIQPVERKIDDKADFYAARRLLEREMLAGAVTLIIFLYICILLLIIGGVIAACHTL
jgi:hypothetical protein